MKYFILTITLTISILANCQIIRTKVNHGKGNVENIPPTQELEIDSLGLERGIKKFKPIINDTIRISFPLKISDGKWVAYFIEDTTKIALEVTFKNSKLNGSSIYYYLNGNIMSMSLLKNDRLHGKGYSFYPSGMIRSASNYVDGEIKISIDYNENGEIENCVEWSGNGLDRKSKKIKKCSLK